MDVLLFLFLPFWDLASCYVGLLYSYFFTAELVLLQHGSEDVPRLYLGGINVLDRSLIFVGICYAKEEFGP